MKGKLCFGLLLALPIIFGLSLSVSLDANAITVTTEATPTGNKTTVNRVVCKYLDNSQLTSTSGINYCVTPISAIQNQSDLTAIQTYSKISTTENYYYRGFLSLKSAVGEPEVLWRIDTNQSNWDVVEFKEIINESMFTEYSYILDNPCTRDNTSGSWLCEESYGKTYSKFYEVTLRARQTGSYYWFFGDSQNALIYNSRDLISPSDGNLPLLSLYTIDEFAPGTPSDQQNQEDRDNLEQQSSDTSDASSDSSQDASSTGTTLLGAFSSFVTALTSATPSNCNLDMDLGNLDLGVVDLCQLSLPQPLPTIASITLILFCVPLSIATARKVINLFRSFQ